MLGDPKKGNKRVLDGKGLPKRDDLIPMKAIHEGVVEIMSRELAPRNITQVARLAGKPAASGADDDDKEPASAPVFLKFKPQSQPVVKEILDEISLPPLKGIQGTCDDLDCTCLPPFSPALLKQYEGKLAADSKLRQAIHKARVALWAASCAIAPRELQKEVMEVRKKMRFDLGIMRERYVKPGGGQAETRFKGMLFRDGQDMARIIAPLEDVLDELKAAGTEKDKAPKRWQANYTYMLARLQAQLTYLEEYQRLLGQMRKEFPPMDEKIHSGWKMAATEKSPGDSVAYKYFKAARNGYKELTKKYRGTPWEVFGKREELTSLGLEWQPY
jgi:hypothetical protein